jgi:hypothetical protein
LRIEDSPRRLGGHEDRHKGKPWKIEEFNRRDRRDHREKKEEYRCK